MEEIDLLWEKPEGEEEEDLKIIIISFTSKVNTLAAHLFLSHFFQHYLGENMQ